MSSPVFTITATSSAGTARTSPPRKRAAPTPPARATTRAESGGMRVGGSAGGRIALYAQLAQLVLESRQAIGDRGHLTRLALPLRALRIADVVAERSLVGRDAPLELRDPRVERGELLVGVHARGRRRRLGRRRRGGGC